MKRKRCAIGLGGRSSGFDRSWNRLRLAPKSEGWSIKAREWDFPTIDDDPGDYNR